MIPGPPLSSQRVSGSEVVVLVVLIGRVGVEIILVVVLTVEELVLVVLKLVSIVNFVGILFIVIFFLELVLGFFLLFRSPSSSATMRGRPRYDGSSSSRVAEPQVFRIALSSSMVDPSGVGGVFG